MKTVLNLIAVLNLITVLNGIKALNRKTVNRTNSLLSKFVNNIVISGLVLAFALIVSACGSGGFGDNGFDDPIRETVYDSGTVDFSRYVALGDSLTAGFKDGALYLEGQENSFGNILAGIFANAGGGAFTQPLVEDNLGGLTLSSTPISSALTRLVFAGSSRANLTPVRQSGTPTTEVTNSSSGVFNNMGVPGAKSFHLLATSYGDVAGLLTVPATANPFAVRFGFAATVSTTILAEAAAQVPTFFSLWIGNNDILAYATTGGDGSDPITDTTTFTSVYGAAVTTLRAVGAKGILLNIPAVTDIPFFTTVPYNAIPLDSATAAATNAAYIAYNAGLTAAVAGSAITQMEADERTITFTAGQNAVVIVDENLTDLSGSSLPSIRQATSADLILLPLSSTLGTERTPGDPTTVIGVGSALLDSEALTYTEVSTIEAARTAFNTTIAGLAASDPDLALFDVAALLAELNDNGLDYGSGTVTSTFGTGGAFSLDGIHPTAKGYAVIVNEVVDTLEASFGASLSRVDPNDFSDVFFENAF